jgi:hypothetical protein
MWPRLCADQHGWDQVSWLFLHLLTRVAKSAAYHLSSIWRHTGHFVGYTTSRNLPSLRIVWLHGADSRSTAINEYDTHYHVLELADGYQMANEMDVASLTTCQVAPEGHYVRLNFEDALGRPAALRLTTSCVQQLVMTLPHLLSRALKARHGDGSLRAVFPLGEWRLEVAAGSKDFILTMMTPDGFEVAFSLSAAAIAGMTSAIEEHSSTLIPDRRRR